MRNYEPRKKIPKSIRMKLWNLYFGLDIGKVCCPVCRERDIYQMDHEVGHIKARAKWGSNNICNLIPICSMCNKSMGTTNLITYSKKWHGGIIVKIINKAHKKLDTK